jgi:hypothetical protein
MIVKSFFLVTMKDRFMGLLLSQSKQSKSGGKKRKLQRKALRLAAFSMLFGLGFYCFVFSPFSSFIGI